MIRLDLDRRSPVMEIINMSENDVSRLILALKFCNEMCKDTNLDIYTEQEKEAILKKCWSCKHFSKMNTASVLQKQRLV